GLQAHFQFVGQAARQRTLCKRFKPSDIVRMCGGADASLQPLVEADAGILEGRAVRVQPLVLRSVDTDELWRKIKRLAEYRVTFAQRLRQFLVLGHVDPGPDKPLKHPTGGRRLADAPHMTNRSVGTHNPFREVESAMLRQHRLNYLLDELP